MAYNLETGGEFKAFFSENKNILIGQNFVDPIPKEGTYKLNIVFPEDPAPTASLLLYAYHAEQQPIRGTFTLITKDKELEMLTFDNTGYFLRVYPENGKNVKEILEGSYIRNKILEPTTVTFVGTIRDGAMDLDEEEFEAVGDYVVKGQKNCYGTGLFSGTGGTIIVQLEKPEINVYVNPAALPDNLEDFAYKYLKEELTYSPSEANFGSIKISLPESHIDSDAPVYFCIEGSGDELIYAIEIKEEVVPSSLEQDQGQKVYLKGNETTLLFYPKLLHNDVPMKLHLKVEEGSVNVLVKPKLSFFHAFIVYRNITNNENPFDTVYPEDTLWIALTPKQGEIIKHVPNTDKALGTFIILQSAYKNSAITLKVSLENPVRVLSSDGFVLAIPSKSKECMAIPDVPPAAEKLEIKFITRSRVNPVRLGRVGVSRKGILQDVSMGEKIVEIDGKSEEVVIEFTKTEETSLEGTYFMTIEAFEPLNLIVKSKVIARPDDKEAKEVLSLSQPSFNGLFSLHTLDDETTHIGYFTYYLNNTDSAGKSEPCDMLIVANDMGSLVENTLMVSTTTWPDKTKSLWHGNYTRILKNDSNYAMNSYYYITDLGITKEQQQEEHMGMSFKQSPTLEFIVFKETSIKKIPVEEHQIFDQSKVFSFDASGEENYIVRKTSSTSESLYISVTPDNTLPFSDKFDYMKEGNPAKSQQSPRIQDEVLIQREDIKNVNPNCAKGSCPVYVTVHCSSQACLYDLVVEKVEKKGGKKVDL